MISRIDFRPLIAKSSRRSEVPSASWSGATTTRLGALTTLGVGGSADVLCRPASVAGVRHAVTSAVTAGRPWRVLGRGSNLLIDDAGVDGWVIDLRRLSGITFGDDGLVTVGAGVNTSVLLGATRRRGLGGLECLVGYPATVGGAVRMNAGGRWGATGERIESVVVVDRDGAVREVTHDECAFAYRSSAFARSVIVEARFRLPHVDPEAYRAAVEEIQTTKAAAQPLQMRSAGCMFRNPEGLSAGRLVDDAGMLGLRHGDAEVSPVHGNFVVNHGSASAADVFRVLDDVRAEVQRVHGVELELEVEVWRRSGT